jgi:hypothetical protein
MPAYGVHRPPIANRVKVQVSPLDHVNRVLFQKPEKGVNFPGCVAEPRAIQVINRDKLIVRQRRIDAFKDIGKTVSSGTKICIVAFFCTLFMLIRTSE